MSVFQRLSKQKKQVIILYVSTMIGTLLGVLSSIVNTRYLDPLDYGNVRYVQNIINFIASILLFGYFLSGSRLLALSDDIKRSAEIRGCMILILGVALIFLMLATGINYFFQTKQYGVADLFLISLPVCAQPLLLNYLNTTAQGDNHIGRLALTRCLPPLLYIPIAYLIFTHYGASASLMILLQWGSAVIIYISIIFSTKPSFNNLHKIFHELNQENKTYGFHLYTGSLVMVTSGYLAGIFLGIFNEDNINVGFYTLAMTITGPLQMLPAIIGTTYFKKFATQSCIPSQVLKATMLLSVGSCVLFILIIYPLVKFLYSESYAVVGIYAAWLAVGFSLHGIGDMFNRYLGSHGQGKSIRNSSFACGSFKIFGFCVLVMVWDIVGALVTVIISNMIYFVCMIIYYIKFINYERIKV